jgi:putative membrane protein
MLWFKAFHLIFMVCWFAGIFYLPRLFVYHAEPSVDAASDARFKIMERRLYRGIMTPCMILTLLCGLGIFWSIGWAPYATQGWLHIKLMLVGLLVVYHFICGRHLRRFARNENRRSPLYFRVFNELPVFILVPVILLATLRPVFH